MIVDFRQNIQERCCFNRAINAAFLTHDRSVVEFVYRMLKQSINSSANTKLSPKEAKAAIDTFEKQFMAEFKFNADILTMKSLKPFNFATEWAELEDLVYIFELHHPALRLWNRDDSSLPGNEWDRFWGSGWVGRHGFELIVPDKDYQYPPGYCGKSEMEWQQDLLALSLGMFTEADDNGRSAKNGVGTSITRNLLNQALDST